MENAESKSKIEENLGALRAFPNLWPFPAFKSTARAWFLLEAVE